MLIWNTFPYFVFMSIAIQLFNYQDKEIRTVKQGRDVWFAAVDVFQALDLTWKGSGDLKKRQISAKWIMRKDSASIGGLQETIFINEQAVYKLAFRANKSEAADKFTNWVAELLVRIRRSSIPNFAGVKPEDHLQIGIQKTNSKAINAKMFMDGDVNAIKHHNTVNCEVHTGKKPAEIKQIGKGLGLKSKERSSAKEVIRHVRPELAASMSMTDRLTGENNIDSKVAAETCKQFAVPLFKKLIEIGATKNLQID